MTQNRRPVVKGVSYFLAHVPSMVRHGSKPSREIAKDPSLLTAVLDHLWTYDRAVAYPPNQAFIGNLDPGDLLYKIPPPWYENLIPNASRWGAFGEIMPEEEFYGMIKICDEFGLLLLEEGFLQEVNSKLKKHPLISPADLQRLRKGVPLEQIERKLSEETALPIYVQGDRLVGCLQRAHEDDLNLIPDVLVENLAARASGVLALRHLVTKNGKAQEVDYLLGCGEEAVGDRYNRGGGTCPRP